MGLDRKIEKSFWSRKNVIRYGAVVLVVAVLIFLVVTGDSSSRLNVDAERHTISSVRCGPFQVYIALPGTVSPIKTIYLDAIEGGRVEKVVREAGSLVEKGDTILHLANTNLLLDIMNREAQLFEQRNNLRNTRLAMQQNALTLEGQLAQLDYEIDVSERQYQLDSQMLARNHGSETAYKNSRAEYNYNRKRRDLTLRTQRQDSLFRSLQIEMLEASVDRIQGNLEIVRRNLDNLFLTAPATGRLTSLNAEIGESKARGQRLGQIDILDGFKVRVPIDEHYISRVDVGLRGTCEVAHEEYELEITKKNYEVRDGRFEVDMEFVGEAPADIRRGQTIHLRLALTESSEALLLPRGAFHRNTGGNWAYVVDRSGEFAVKREIDLGNMNPQVFEVMGGLEEGEQVITSSYDSFGDVEKLILSN